MKIQPTIIEETSKIGANIKINPIIFDLEAPTCVIQYIITDENNALIKHSKFELTEEEYAGWGTDNSYIEDIVLNKLSLTRLIEE